MSLATHDVPPTALNSDQARFRDMEDKILHGISSTDFDLDAAAQLLDTFRTSAGEIYLNQRLSEWKNFLRMLQDRGFPKTILEIGTGRGGSAYFWSRLAPAGAKIVTVDLSEGASEYVAIYQRPEVNPVTCITGDSRSEDTVHAVVQAMEGRKIDLLYIDGDHTYEGVKADFETYAPMLAANSRVAFHDIHPDFFQARGVKTSCDSGEVFRFWNELKANHVFREFVAEPRAEQDGFGLGVIEHGV